MAWTKNPGCRIDLDALAERHTLRYKRGQHASVEEDAPLPAQQAVELLAVDQALDRVAAQDARKAKVMEFAGYNC